MNPEKLMRLQAEPPAWVGQAVVKCGRGIGLAVRSVHRLEEVMAEAELLELVRRRTRLRKNQLDLIATGDNELGPGLGTHAEPVDAIRGR